MKTKKLMTTAVALMLSVGVVSCASDKEKQQKHEEQRQEEARELEQQQQEAEEEARQAESELEAMRQEQQDSMADSEFSTDASQSDKPWADQQVSLDKVEKVQEKLKSEGYEVGSVDGLIGPNTSSALEKFQSDKGLNANGELTQETIDEMGLDIKIDSASEFAE